MTARPPTRSARAPFFPPAAGLRAVITDIDGTLTGPDRTLDPSATALLRRLRAAGTPVILATGNVLPVAIGLARALGLHGPIVAENGGLIYDPSDGNDRVELLSDRRIAWQGFLDARRAGLPVRRLFTDRWRRTEVAIEPTVAPSAIERVVDRARIRVEGTGFAVHFMEAGHGKRRALDLVLERLGLRWDECLVAGDGDNDVGMLKAAGWGVSFANASPRARAAADYVATRANAEGFVEAVKERATLGRA